MSNPFVAWLRQNDIRPAWAAAALGFTNGALWACLQSDYWPSRAMMSRIHSFTGGAVKMGDFIGNPEIIVADREAGAILLQHIEEFKNAQTETDKRTARYKLRHPEGQTRPASKGKERVAGNGSADGRPQRHER